MILSIIALLLPVWAAYLSCGALLPRAAAPPVLRIPLAIGLGIGFSSLSYFACLCLFRVWGPLPASLDLGFYGAVVAALSLRAGFRKGGRNGGPVASAPPGSRMDSTIAACFYALLPASLLAVLAIAWANPHGEWDAWAIWNLRAIFLCRGGADWMDAFSPLLDWSHPDYPLMLPGAVARLWYFAGGESFLAPGLLAVLFTFSTVLLLTVSVAALAGKRQGYLAGMAILGSFSCLEQGTFQQADVPLSFFIHAGTVLSTLSHAQPAMKFSGGLVLAGGAACFAAWTKNEGVAFLLALGLSMVMVAGIQKRWSDLGPRFFWLGLGALPVLAALAVFKFSFAPPNDLLSSRNIYEISEKLASPYRYWLVAKEFLLEFFHMGIGPILAAYFLIAGGASKQRVMGLALLPLGVVGFLLIEYYFVYILTPYGVYFHMKTSLYRLIAQLWPTLLFVFFLVVKDLKFRSDTPLLA